MHGLAIIVLGICVVSGVLAEDEEYQLLLSEVIRIKVQLENMESNVAALQEEITRRNGTPTNDGGSSTYIRWGRTSCPEERALVYHGYAAGNHYTLSGGGSNRLCLPTDPKWKEYVAGFQSIGRLYGSEYQVSQHPFLKHLHDHDVPCAVCRIPRSTVLMIPGRFECYDNFTLEYSGYLMSEYHSHTSSEYVCMDENPEKIDNGEPNQNGALFYLVESVCGSLPCPPYENGKEVTCVVCSYAPQNNIHP